jgi:oligopeptidase B
MHRHANRTEGDPMYRFVLALSLLLVSCSRPPEEIVTPKIPKEFVEHGTKRIDDYYWLSNPADSNVIAHLKRENAYTDALLKHTEALQRVLYDELVSRIEQRYESLPERKNGYWYALRYQEGAQYPVLYRRKDAPDATEEVLLDLPTMARGHQIFLLSGTEASPDNRLLAYGVDTSGNRKNDLHVLDLSTRTLSPEAIPNTSGLYAWSADARSLFYVVLDHAVRPYLVKLHRVGASPETDREIFRESDSTLEVSLSTSRDRRTIFITSGYTEDREVRYLAADNPDARPVVIQARQKDLAYSILDCEEGMFFIRTNAGAKNFRLVRAPIRTPSMAHWTDVIPARSDAYLEGARVFRDYVIAQQRILGLPQILVMDRKKGSSRYVDFREEAYVAAFGVATDAYDLDSIRYSYTSLTTPRAQYRYDCNTGLSARLKQEKVGGGFVDSLYTTRRLWATGKDSVRVPVSIVYKNSLLKMDGSNPMLLYAYGSYGSSSDPYFNRNVISLLDRGFVFGIAHIRGGQELGRPWYDDGKLLKKKNTFADFITCAEQLVRDRYTSPDRLFANGGSAGGMLMGAITNMRPDLFRGVLADVPWMDVVTDMFNTDLPLTTQEFGEWGNPAIKEEYDYMMSWSPYDNVRDAAYPAILATGGLNDTNVPYYSPAKWVAKVREHNRGRNPVLFKVNMGAGHGGESGRFERQKLAALRYAFILDLAGIDR